MPTLTDQMRKLSSILPSNDDDLEYRNNMGLYCGEFYTYASARKAVENDMSGYDARGFVEDILCVDDVDEYINDIVRERGLNPEQMSDEQKDEIYIEHLIDQKIESIKPQLSIAGIQHAWDSSTDFNHGNQAFIVSRINPVNPWDNTSEETLIEIDTVSNAALEAKINFGLQKSPDKSFGLLVGRGVHWLVLAVDPPLKKYRVMDSYGVKQEEEFYTKLRDCFPKDFEMLPENRVKQQQDSNSCGAWVIRNCQGIIDNGGNIEIECQPDNKIQELVVDMIEVCSNTVVRSLREAPSSDAIPDKLVTAAISITNPNPTVLITGTTDISEATNTTQEYRSQVQNRTEVGVEDPEDSYRLK